MTKSLFSKLIPVLFTAFAFHSASVMADMNEPAPKWENHLSIGPGVSYNSAGYHGMDGYAEIWPVFSFRLGRLYGYNDHNEPEIGWNLFKHKRISLAIAATRTRAKLELDDINADKEFLFYGLEDRDDTIEAGFVFNYFSRNGLLEINVFHDVKNQYDGVRSNIAISRPFPNTGNWYIVPRMYIKHYSEKFNAFYYGVSEQEQEDGVRIAESQGFKEDGTPDDPGYNQIRPEYIPGNSGHWGIDIKFQYKFTESLLGTGYIAVEKYSGPIETSPLIEDKELILTSLGLRYTF